MRITWTFAGISISHSRKVSGIHGYAVATVVYRASVATTDNIEHADSFGLQFECKQLLRVVQDHWQIPVVQEVMDKIIVASFGTPLNTGGMSSITSTLKVMEDEFPWHP
jgi:hypothetical protein